jgi:hypothetical protein
MSAPCRVPCGGVTGPYASPLITGERRPRADGQLGRTVVRAARPGALLESLTHRCEAHSDGSLEGSRSGVRCGFKPPLHTCDLLGSLRKEIIQTFLLTELIAPPTMADETELTIAGVTSLHEFPRGLAAKAVSVPQVVATVPWGGWCLWKSLAVGRRGDCTHPTSASYFRAVGILTSHSG